MFDEMSSAKRRVLFGVRGGVVAGLTAAAIAATALAGCGNQAATSGSAAGSAPVEQAAAIKEVSESGKDRTVKNADGADVTVKGEVKKVAVTDQGYADAVELLSGGKIDSVVVANADEAKSADAQLAFGPAGAFDAADLESAGVTFVSLPAATSLEALEANYQTMGDALGDNGSARAKELVSFTKDQAETVKKLSAKKSFEANAVVLSVENGKYYVAGNDTFAGSALEVAGLTNAAAGYTNDSKSADGTMSEISADDLVNMNPKFIFTLDQKAYDAALKDTAISKKVVGVKSWVAQQGTMRPIPTGESSWASGSVESCLLPAFYAHVAFADVYDGEYDMEQTVKDFYKTFYNKKLSTHDAESIITGATDAR